MALPFSWEDTLRAHDLAVSKWLGGLHVDYKFTHKGVVVINRPNCPILRFFATPQRAFSEIIFQLQKQGFVDGATAQAMASNAGQFDVLPLPICTISRGEPTLDPELSAPAKVFETKVFDPSTGQFIQHPWGGHYRTEYTVTLWSVKNYSDVFMREWVMAEFGAGRGTSYVEKLLPVQHKDPWGLMKQSFKMTGSVDLSDLEGEAQRYRRVEFTFSLRTWFFRLPSDEQPQVNRIGFTSLFPPQDYEMLTADPGSESEEFGRVDVQSANLWSLPLYDDLIPTLWPKTGDATVQRANISPRGGFGKGPYNGLTMTVKTSDDSVTVCQRLIAPDDGPYSLVSVSFQYLSDADTVLEIAQQDPSTDPLTTTSAFVLTLPSTGGVWKRVHVFTVIAKPIFQVSIVGAGTTDAADITVVDPEIRQIMHSAASAPTRIDAGTEWHYVWTGLAPAPSLVIALLGTTTGSGNTFSVDNAATMPTYTNQQSIDQADNVGVVALTQPLSSAVVARIPKTVTLASISLQQYAGAYNGHQI